MATDLQRLRTLCQEALAERGLSEESIYEKRLKWEIAEIKAQDEAVYFLDLHARGVKYADNENNLLTAWLLGVCDTVKPDQDPECVYGEYPDIDVDYLKSVRDYLKNDWAVKEFGAEFVCNIGNYTTFGIKMAFLDCATTYGESRHEINAITTQLKLKDDEGKGLTFDKALELYPDLKAYSEKYPHIAKAVKKMLHRNRGMGKHAGGLIIADNQIPEYRIDNLVPLVKNAKDGSISSAFVEGLHGQDLGPLGLIKFDMLVIADLERMAIINRLIKKRHGLIGVCARPETPDWDWSDGCYRCDVKALNLANGGDLLGVFQFDSDGIRKLAREGGVTNFRDIVAYSAIYRPGPLNMGMDKNYIERKHGREKYSVHPLLEPYLGYTYGVMCFQEQVMQVLHHAGIIPLKDTYAVVKAIAKKKLKGFAKYKDMFIKNSQVTLGLSEAEAIHLWGQIESFAEYGFNRSVDQTTIVVSSQGPKQIKDFKPGDIVYTVDPDGNTVETPVMVLHDHGTLEGFEITFDNGSKVICSRDHKFLTPKGQMPFWKILQTSSSIMVDPIYEERYGEREEGRLGGEMRLQVSHQNGTSQPSGDLCRLPSGGVACEAEWREGDTSYTVRSGVSELQVARATPAGVRGVRPHQAGEHSAANGETQQGQRVATTTCCVFGDGQENSSKTGSSGRKSGTARGLAQGQPGQVGSLHGGGVQESKTFQDGGMAPLETRLGHVSDSLRRGTQAGGLRLGRDMDRGGRSLPLQRTAGSRRSVQASVLHPVAGCDVECGSGTSWGRDADPCGDDVLRGNEWRDEARVVPATDGHAGIADTGRLVFRRIVRVVSVGKRRMYDLEVASPTHNFVLAGGVVTSNSHSCAYSYVSSRLLYQKANYPLEFWAGTLAVEEDTDVLNLYRRQANRAGITVNCLDLNRSTETFGICDENDEIYMGFGNIKGVGESPARRIVEARNDGGGGFKGIEDFMNRFGTDASVLRALIGLRLFKESDPLTLAKFVVHFKDTATKNKQRHQRYVKSMQNYEDKLTALVPENLHKWKGWTEQFLALVQKKLDKDVEIEVEVEEEYDTGVTEEIEEVTFKPKDPDFDTELFDIDQLEPDALEEVRVKKTVPVMATRTITKKKKFNAFKQLKKEFQMRARSMRQYEERNIEEKTESVTLASFNSATVKLDPKHVAMLQSRKNSELEYLGFEWQTAMELSPDYNPEKPHTYDDAEALAIRGLTAIKLDGEIQDVQSRQSRAKNTTYHSLVLADAVGRRGYINVWKMDWERCKADLKKGNLVSLIVRPPTDGFKSYSLWTPAREKQYELAQKGIVQCVVLTKREEEVLTDDDFEKKMTELTGGVENE